MHKRLAITPSKVFVLLQQHGPQTADELAMRLGWGQEGVPAVQEALDRLRETGTIKATDEPEVSMVELARDWDDTLDATRWQNAD